MTRSVLRPLVGLASIAVAVVVVLAAWTAFNGGFVDSVRVTVVSPRAGLVMYPDAKVKMRGVTVGRVASVDTRPDGRAELQLAMDPVQIARIPSDVTVNVASTTVFGAKFVDLVPPAAPSGQPLEAGQVLDADRVTVEINTVFQQLTQVLEQVEPEKLSATLGAIAAATSGRGEQLGKTVSDLNAFLGTVEPALPALRNDLELAPTVAGTYADSAQPLLDTAGNATRTSQSIVEEQQNLDAFLVSVIGLADVGNQVLTDNRDALSTTLDLLVPTTSLTNSYNEALTCSLTGLAYLADSKPVDVPGLGLSANFLWGTESYTYPKNLPRVAASGGPQCSVLPVSYEDPPPFVVADTGANPFASGRQGLELNSTSLPLALFGTIKGTR
ncbi:MCE family protein [Rhodococcus gannanensis]|uniref:MCE family protein n=1 Tax=Rhodococcus gannanensis TaxID=1960308 RepID=A0ABW4P103_9NOCA